eukprot:gene2370-255_t
MTEFLRDTVHFDIPADTIQPHLSARHQATQRRPDRHCDGRCHRRRPICVFLPCPMRKPSFDETGGMEPCEGCVCAKGAAADYPNAIADYPNAVASVGTARVAAKPAKANASVGAAREFAGSTAKPSSAGDTSRKATAEHTGAELTIAGCATTTGAAGSSIGAAATSTSADAHHSSLTGAADTAGAEVAGAAGAARAASAATPTSADAHCSSLASAADTAGAATAGAARAAGAAEAGVDELLDFPSDSADTGSADAAGADSDDLLDFEDSEPRKDGRSSPDDLTITRTTGLLKPKIEPGVQPEAPPGRMSPFAVSETASEEAFWADPAPSAGDGEESPADAGITTITATTATGATIELDVKLMVDCGLRLCAGGKQVGVLPRHAGAASVVYTPDGPSPYELRVPMAVLDPRAPKAALRASVAGAITIYIEVRLHHEYGIYKGALPSYSRHRPVAPEQTIHTTVCTDGKFLTLAAPPINYDAGGGRYAARAFLHYSPLTYHHRDSRGRGTPLEFNRLWLCAHCTGVFFMSFDRSGVPETNDDGTIICNFKCYPKSTRYAPVSTCTTPLDPCTAHATDDETGAPRYISTDPQATHREYMESLHRFAVKANVVLGTVSSCDQHERSARGPDPYVTDNTAVVKREPAEAEPRRSLHFGHPNPPAGEHPEPLSMSCAGVPCSWWDLSKEEIAERLGLTRYPKELYSIYVPRRCGYEVFRPTDTMRIYITFLNPTLGRQMHAILREWSPADGSFTINTVLVADPPRFLHHHFPARSNLTYKVPRPTWYRAVVGSTITTAWDNKPAFYVEFPQDWQAAGLRKGQSCAAYYNARVFDHPTVQFRRGDRVMVLLGGSDKRLNKMHMYPDPLPRPLVAAIIHQRNPHDT